MKSRPVYYFVHFVFAVHGLLLCGNTNNGKIFSRSYLIIFLLSVFMQLRSLKERSAEQEVTGITVTVQATSENTGRTPPKLQWCKTFKKYLNQFSAVLSAVLCSVSFTKVRSRLLPVVNAAIVSPF